MSAFSSSSQGPDTLSRGILANRSGRSDIWEWILDVVIVEINESLLVQQKMEISGMLHTIFNLTVKPNKYVPVNTIVVIKIIKEQN